MPRILGLNALGVVLASVAFFFVGFLWYGLIFQDLWSREMGITEEMAAAAGNQTIWMIGGFVITVMQVIGIGFVLKWRGVTGLSGAVATALTLWFFLALPFTHYAYIYGAAHSSTLLMIDASHLLVGWLVSAILLALFR